MSGVADRIFDVRDRVAVVTGASAGIGARFARVLAEAGAHLVLAARRGDKLEGLAQELERDFSVDVLPHACNVADSDEVDGLVAAASERFERVDILVNNAGITRIYPVEDEPLEVFDEVVAVNLRGVFMCTQRFGRGMLERAEGSVVNIASILGVVGTGQVKQASYAASKGAVVNMTREIAAQWARKGVRCNAIAPGWFGSEMTEEMFGQESSQRWMKQKTPMGRPGRDGELDGALLFLASDASSFVTGHTLLVDGGWTIV